MPLLPLRRWFERLTGRRARALNALATAVGQHSAPLTVTDVRREEFSLMLPGTWYECRTTAGFEFANKSAPEILTVATRKLVVPVEGTHLVELAERVIAEQRASAAQSFAGQIIWTDSEVRRHPAGVQARCEGYTASPGVHLALLLRATPQRVLTVILSRTGDRSSATAFANFATVIFDRVE